MNEVERQLTGLLRRVQTAQHATDTNAVRREIVAMQRRVEALDPHETDTKPVQQLYFYTDAVSRAAVASIIENALIGVVNNVRRSAARDSDIALDRIRLYELRTEIDALPAGSQERSTLEALCNYVQYQVTKQYEEAANRRARQSASRPRTTSRTAARSAMVTAHRPPGLQRQTQEFER